MTAPYQEFQTVEGVFDPVEPTVFFGISPLLVALVIGLMAVAAIIAWLLGQESGRKTGDGCDAIWRAINDASLKALSAPTGELQARVQDLRDTIRRYLGDVLDLAKGVSGPFGEMEKALKGEVAQEPAKDNKPEGCRCGRATGVCGCGSGAAAASAAVAVSISVAGSSADGASDRREGEPSEAEAPRMVDKKPDPKPGVRPMTIKEQSAALAAAARAFHDHWSNKADRLAELRAARRALCHPPAAPKTHGVPGGGHH